MELHRLYCGLTYMQTRIKNVLRQIRKNTVLLIGYEQKSIIQLKKNLMRFKFCTYVSSKANKHMVTYIIVDLKKILDGYNNEPLTSWWKCMT